MDHYIGHESWPYRSTVGVEATLAVTDGGRKRGEEEGQEELIWVLHRLPPD